MFSISSGFGANSVYTNNTGSFCTPTKFTFGQSNLFSGVCKPSDSVSVSGIESTYKDGFTTNINVSYQSVCFLKGYENKSFEEIRYEKIQDEKMNLMLKNQFKSIKDSLFSSNSHLFSEYKAKMDRTNSLRKIINEKAEEAIRPIRDKEKELLNEIDKIENKLKSVELLHKTLENLICICQNNQDLSVVKMNTKLLEQIQSDFSEFQANIKTFTNFNNEYNIISSGFIDSIHQLKIEPNMRFGSSLDRLILDLEHSFYKLNKSIGEFLFESSQARLTKAKQQENKPFRFSTPNPSLFSLFGNVNTQSTNACLFGTPFGNQVKNDDKNTAQANQNKSLFSLSSNTTQPFGLFGNVNKPSANTSLFGTPFGQSSQNSFLSDQKNAFSFSLSSNTTQPFHFGTNPNDYKKDSFGSHSDLRNSFNQLNKSVEDLLFETSQVSSTKAKPQEITNLFGNVNTQSTNACLFGTPFGNQVKNDYKNTAQANQNKSLFSLSSNKTQPFSFGVISNEKNQNLNTTDYKDDSKNSLTNDNKHEALNNQNTIQVSFDPDENYQKPNIAKDKNDSNDEKNLLKDFKDEEIFSQECKLSKFDKEQNEWKDLGDGLVRIYKTSNEKTEYIVIVSRDLKEIYLKVFGYQISSRVTLESTDEKTFKWKITESDYDKETVALITIFDTKEQADVFKNEFENFKTESNN